jgi:diaminopimelate decarboxylase
MEVIGRHGFKVYIEPGDRIVKDAGILVAQVIEVEKKGAANFAFVDAGFNLHPEPAFYNLPCEPIPLKQPSSTSDSLTTIVGNINEALDVFNANHPILLTQNDYIAFINAGAYGASMSSNHCLRSTLKEIIL